MLAHLPKGDESPNNQSIAPVSHPNVGLLQ